MAQTQGGILLHPNGACPPREEVAVPAPPPAGALPDPATYAALLPGVPPSELRVEVVPASTKLGCGTLLLVFDRRFRPPGAELNEQAVFLSASLDTGFGRQLYGRALALCAEPGRDLPMRTYNEIDNIIRGPMMDTFGDGRPPTEKAWARWARDLGLQLSRDPEACCACCGAPDAPLRCSRCQKARYCDAACQRDGWRDGHKQECPLLAAQQGAA